MKIAFYTLAPLLGLALSLALPGRDQTVGSPNPPPENAAPADDVQPSEPEPAIAEFQRLEEEISHLQSQKEQIEVEKQALEERLAELQEQLQTPWFLSTPIAVPLFFHQEQSPSLTGVLTWTVHTNQLGRVGWSPRVHLPPNARETFTRLVPTTNIQQRGPRDVVSHTYHHQPRYPLYYPLVVAPTQPTTPSVPQQPHAPQPSQPPAAPHQLPRVGFERDPQGFPPPLPRVGIPRVFHQPEIIHR